MSEIKPPRMENIKTTAQLFDLPIYTVRNLVLSGRVNAVRSGKRIFVNTDKFAEFLNTSTLMTEPEIDEAAKVNPIERWTYGRK